MLRRGWIGTSSARCWPRPLVGFLAYTGFMAVRGLVQFSELLVQSEQPLAEAGIVLALSLPHIVVLTLPVAFLLGLLIGVGRLSADSELTALRASGIDLAGLYRPIGVLAAAIAGLTLFLMLAVVPRTNHLLYTMKLRLSSFAFAQRIQPGVFSPEFGGLRVYVEKASADRRELSGLIISDRSNPEEGDRLTLARRGWLELEEDQGRLWLRVEDAETHHQQDGGKTLRRDVLLEAADGPPGQRPGRPREGEADPRAEPPGAPRPGRGSAPAGPRTAASP